MPLVAATLMISAKPPDITVITMGHSVTVAVNSVRRIAITHPIRRGEPAFLRKLGALEIDLLIQHHKYQKYSASDADGNVGTMQELIDIQVEVRGRDMRKKDAQDNAQVFEIEESTHHNSRVCVDSMVECLMHS